MSGRFVVLSTVGSAEDAERIGRELVERRLAACVNVVPAVTSIYRWKGKVERGEERLLLIKTRAERFPALRDALVSLHPYEVPEVVALRIEDGHEPYLAWLDEGVDIEQGGAVSRPPDPRSLRGSESRSARSSGRKRS